MGFHFELSNQFAILACILRIAAVDATGYRDSKSILDICLRRESGLTLTEMTQRWRDAMLAEKWRAG